MPRTLWNESDRGHLLARVERLRPDMHPLWGKMSATQMLTHLTDWMRMGTGELAVAPRRNFLRYPGVKHLIIYVAPFPKEVPTAPELIARHASGFDDERTMLRAHLASLVEIQPSTVLPSHPAFGRISNRAWGVLGYRHTDHHLRQFGV
jgi:uncharacterized protein DUF1569